MEVSSLLLFAGALVVVAGSPGPNVAALVARVLSDGPRRTLPFVAAFWLGEAVWLGCAVWGLAAIAETLHLLFAAIKYAGVAYLLYLAWRMWTAPAVSPDDAPDEGEGLPRARSAGRLFAAGLAVTLGNPKIMMFYLALLPTLVDLGRITVLGWAELTATLVLVLMAVDLSWVVLAARARRLLRSRRAVRLANRAGAAVMAGAAAAIATR